MDDRATRTDAVISWALAFALLLGVTMCLRVLSLRVDATLVASPPAAQDAASPAP